jgi:chromosome segregation ATPase
MIALCRRCEELEGRERELLKREEELREALAQAAARAVAAEGKLDTRVQELTAAHEELAKQLMSSMKAETEVCVQSCRPQDSSTRRCQPCIQLSGASLSRLRWRYKLGQCAA